MKMKMKMEMKMRIGKKTVGSGGASEQHKKEGRWRNYSAQKGKGKKGRRQSVKHSFF